MATATVPVVSTTPVVTLTRDEAIACCGLVWEEIREGCREDREHVARNCATLFNACNWGDEDDDATYEVPVDDSVAWLVRNLLNPHIDEYTHDELQRMRDEQGELPDYVLDGRVDQDYYVNHREAMMAHCVNLIDGTVSLAGGVVSRVLRGHDGA